MREIFTSYNLDNGLILRVCKDLWTLNNREINLPINKHTKDAGGQYWDTETLMANNYFLNCSIFLVIGKFITKLFWDTASPSQDECRQQIWQCRGGYGEKRTLIHCWVCKLIETLQKSVGRFLKKLKINKAELQYDLYLLLLSKCPENSTVYHVDIYIPCLMLFYSL